MPEEILDASGYRGAADRLFTPESEAELLQIVSAAVKDRIPLTVGGGWTGVTGGSVPAEGGWVISTRRLARIEIHPGYALVGAGVLLKDLHQAAADARQFYAPDPTETSASIGGTIANNASGSRSFKYGDTRRHVLGLRVVLMDGTAVWYERGTPIDFEVGALPLPATTKHSAGYRLAPGMDYVDLFAGSEGTLGIVTEAKVRLLPARGELFTGVIFFESEDAALDAADAWRGLPDLAMLEFLDGPSLDLQREKFPDTPKAGAAVIIEEEGDAIDAWADRLEAAPGAMMEESWFAASAQDRERFRRFRHALPEAVNDTVRKGGFQKLGSDFAVPAARNREMMRYYRERLNAFPAPSVVFGHIGDAHVHANILPRTGGEFEAGKALMLEFARKAVELGGTVGAEHGLGKRKSALLAIQYTAEQIDAMRRVRRRFDPVGILSAGNLF